MISYHLVRLIDELVSYFSDDNYVVERLQRLSHLYTSVSPSLVELMAGTANANATVDRCQRLSQLIANEVRDIKDDTTTSEFFKHLRDTIDQTNRFAAQFPKKTLDVTEHLEDLNGAYDQYINSHTPDTATVLLIQGHRTYAAITTFRDTLSSVRDSLIPEPEETTDEEETLTLFFGRTADLEILVQKLSAITTAYQQLCELTGVSYVEQPLRIIKVETGSILIKVVGAVLPIKLLETFIKKVANILYRRCVREGRIEAQSEYRKEIMDEIDLRNALKEAGVDVSKIDERLQHMASQHADELCSLLYGEPSVDVNGVETGIEDLPEQVFLDQFRMLRLEDQQLQIEDDEATPEDADPEESDNDEDA